jgi:hypothetical protein
MLLCAACDARQAVRGGSGPTREHARAAPPLHPDAELVALFGGADREHWLLCALARVPECQGGPALSAALREEIVRKGVDFRELTTLESPLGRLSLVQVSAKHYESTWGMCSEVGVLTVERPVRMVARRVSCTGDRAETVHAEALFQLSKHVTLVGGTRVLTNGSQGTLTIQNLLFRVDQGQFEEVFAWSREEPNPAPPDGLLCSAPRLQAEPHRMQATALAGGALTQQPAVTVNDLLITQRCRAEGKKAATITSERYHWDGRRFVSTKSESIEVGARPSRSSRRKRPTKAWQEPLGC